MITLNIVIVVPLVEEKDYFCETLKGRPGWLEPKNFDRAELSYSFSDDVRTANVHVCTIRSMGHVEAVLRAYRAITSHSPELVLLLGLAGSMNPDAFGLGDVVVSNQVKTYVADKVGTISRDPTETPQLKFSPIPPASSMNGCIVVDQRDQRQSYSFLRYQRDWVHCSEIDAAVSALERVLSDQQLSQLDLELVPQNLAHYQSNHRPRQLHFGWLLGSNYVVDSLEYRQYLVEKNSDPSFDVHTQMREADRSRWIAGDLMAVDMESFGLLKAVEALRTTPPKKGGVRPLAGGLVVRGISDLAEAKSKTDAGSKKELRRLAVRNASQTAAQIIETLDYSLIV